MEVPDILKIVYAPHKAFKELAQKPSYIGPLLIAVLFIALNAGFAYVGTSKTYVQQITPNGQNKDEWTENSTLWASNAMVTESSDHINGTYYGNASIAFALTNGTRVWMQLSSIGPVNCSGSDVYSNVTFRLKQTIPQERPINVTVYLFSSTAANYFSYDLTQSFISTTDIWNNFTIPLVSGWSKGSPDADWASITGFRLELTWSSGSDITVLLDDLFVLGPLKSLLDTGGSNYLLSYALQGAMQFVITWVILSGLLYLLSKTLGAKLVWKIMLIVIGSILITLVVQAIVNMVAYSTLPNINYPFELTAGVQGEGTAALDLIYQQTALVNLIGRFTQIAIYVWTIALAGLGVHLVGELSWTKSFLGATVAYLATIFINGFLFGL